MGAAAGSLLFFDPLAEAFLAGAFLEAVFLGGMERRKWLVGGESQPRYSLSFPNNHVGSTVAL